MGLQFQSAVKKTPQIFIITLSLALLLLFSTNNNTLFSLIVLFGCISVDNICLRSVSVLFKLIFVVFNSEMLSFNLNNRNYICTRYESKEMTIDSLIWQCALSCTLFYIVSLVAAISAAIIVGRSLECYFAFNAFAVISTCYGSCLIFIFLQAMLMSFCGEVKTFIALVSISQAFTYCNPFSILLDNKVDNGSALLLIRHFLFYLIIILQIKVFKKVYLKRWNYHENND